METLRGGAEQLREHFEVNRHYIVVAALKSLADEGALPAAKVAYLLPWGFNAAAAVTEGLAPGLDEEVTYKGDSENSLVPRPVPRS